MSVSLDVYLQAAQQLKESLVAEHGVGTDIQPMLTFIADEVPCGLIHLDSPDVVAAAKWTVAAMRPEEVIATCEIYIDPMNLGRTDDLSRAFPTDPGVIEAVMVSHSVPGRSRGAVMPYRYAGRTVEWLSVDHRENVPVQNPLTRGIENGYQAPLTDPVEALQELERLGLAATLLECPCGSGRPLSDCCAPSVN
jgi:hypothetical protein